MLNEYSILELIQEHMQLIGEKNAHSILHNIVVLRSTNSIAVDTNLYGVDL